MKIVGADLYAVKLYSKMGDLSFGGGKKVDNDVDTTVLRLRTDTDIIGWGEFRLPVGIDQNQGRGLLQTVLPHLIGQDPTKIGPINSLLDDVLYVVSSCGYVRSVIDMACWDILGKSLNVPVYELLGGKHVDSVPVFFCVWNGTEEEAIERTKYGLSKGYTKFQVKVAGDPINAANRAREVRKLLGPNRQLLIDINTAWQAHEAIRFANMVSDLDIYLEEPCGDPKATQAVRAHTNIPILSDESTTDVKAVIDLYKTHQADVLSLKFDRLGGITRTKIARDFCALADLPVRIECVSGGDLLDAAVVHLGVSMPPKQLYCVYDSMVYYEVQYSENPALTVNNRMIPPQGPGLGLNIKMDVLGEPFFSI